MIQFINHIILELSWNDIFKYAAIIFPIASIIYIFKTKKYTDIYNYISIILVTVELLIFNEGAESAVIPIDDFLSGYLLSLPVVFVASIFVLAYIFIVSGNIYSIYTDLIITKIKTKILIASTYLLAIQYFFMKGLEPDFLYLTEETGESATMYLIDSMKPEITNLIIGLLIATIIMFIILIIDQKKKAS